MCVFVCVCNPNPNPNNAHTHTYTCLYIYIQVWSRCLVCNSACSPKLVCWRPDHTPRSYTHAYIHTNGCVYAYIYIDAERDGDEGAPPGPPGLRAGGLGPGVWELDGDPRDDARRGEGLERGEESPEPSLIHDVHLEVMHIPQGGGVAPPGGGDFL